MKFTSVTVKVSLHPIISTVYSYNSVISAFNAYIETEWWGASVVVWDETPHEKMDATFTAAL